VQAETAGLSQQTTGQLPLIWRDCQNLAQWWVDLGVNRVSTIHLPPQTSRIVSSESSLRSATAIFKIVRQNKKCLFLICQYNSYY